MSQNFKIGIDIVSVEKFKKKEYSKNKTFYERFFSTAEIKYCLKYKNPSERFAGKFALKEALIKSLDEKIGFSEIETSHLNSKPLISIKQNNENYNFIASLSHENEFAVGVVISEKII